MGSKCNVRGQPVFKVPRECKGLIYLGHIQNLDAYVEPHHGDRCRVLTCHVADARGWYNCLTMEIGDDTSAYERMYADRHLAYKLAKQWVIDNQENLDARAKA